MHIKQKSKTEKFCNNAITNVSFVAECNLVNFTINPLENWAK